MATQPAPRISLEEYLAIEDHAPPRHEFLDGEMFLIEDATPNHSAICFSIAAELVTQLAGTDCIARGADMGIRTAPNGLYSYPDAVVSCGNQKFDRNILLNPIVIVEVLSPSTENYDRGKKFEAYRRIPSFAEYLIVAQDRAYVEHHVRGDQVWTMREYHQLSDTISLSAVNVRLALSRIYSNVGFPVDDSAPA